jgi:signal transduction histidine kinase
MESDTSTRPFISYAREDAALAKQLFEDLTAMGALPWLDTERLLGGQAWKLEVERAIRNSSHFIALVSHHSVTKRGYVQNEVRKALEVLDEFPPDRVFLIPVRIDAVEPVHDRLKELNWINLFPDYDLGLKKLLISLGIVPPSLAASVAVRGESILSVHSSAQVLEQPAESLDANQVVESVVRAVRVYARDSNIDIRFGATNFVGRLNVSAPTFRLALLNLIDNAIKFSIVPDLSSPDQRPWVGVELKAIEGNVTIRVENWGIPITQDEVREGRLFERLYVGYFARQIRATGLGLGLHFVKRFAEKAGGSVRLIADPLKAGGGIERRRTVIELTLPTVPVA